MTLCRAGYTFECKAVSAGGKSGPSQEMATDLFNCNGAKTRSDLSLAMLLAVLVCTGLESRNEIISDVSLAMFLARVVSFTFFLRPDRATVGDS